MATAPVTVTVPLEQLTTPSHPLDRIRNADFAVLGRLQPAEAYAAVTRDTQAISQAATVLTLSPQAAILLFFTLLHRLPALRDRQCAVLCATHDSRYFAIADRCYMLRDGRLTPSRPDAPSPVPEAAV
jgi:hypothetical protein